MRQEIPLFKIHPSQCYKIMSEPRTKSNVYSEMLKEHCEDYCKTFIYKRKEIINSKYFEKGIKCEQISIERYNKTFNTFYSKNDKEFENDWMIGTPDIFDKILKKVVDLKNSYSPFTFPLFYKNPDKKYSFQLQCYMNLTGATTAELVYCLENLPFEMIENELNKQGLEFTEENASYYVYDDIDDDLRIKIFKFDYDKTIEEKIIEKVEICRKYIREELL